MTDHTGHAAEHGTTAVAEAPAGEAAAHAVVPPGELRFEKQELEEFVAADTHAGRAIGFLLAFLFCVLLFLMSAATIWTMKHQNASDDPHEVSGASESSAH